jgi:hypothetical protein
VIEGVARSTGVRPRRKAAPAVPDATRIELTANPWSAQCTTPSD